MPCARSERRRRLRCIIRIIRLRMSLKRRVIPCVLTSRIPENYLENARTVHAGSVPRGTWKQQGKKGGWSRRKRQPPTQHTGASTLVQQPTSCADTQKLTFGQLQGTVQNSEQLPWTAPLIFRVALIIRRWTRRQLRLGVTALRLRRWRCHLSVLTAAPFLSPCFKISGKMSSLIFTLCCSTCCTSACFILPV